MDIGTKPGLGNPGGPPRNPGGHPKSQVGARCQEQNGAGELWGNPRTKVVASDVTKDRSLGKPGGLRKPGVELATKTELSL